MTRDTVPLGAATIPIIVFCLGPHAAKTDGIAVRGFKAKVQQLDLPGMLALLPAIVCLLLVLQWGSTSSWSARRVIALFIVFGVLILAFGGLQYRAGDAATLPPRILRQRSIVGGSFFICFVGGTLVVSPVHLHGHQIRPPSRFGETSSYMTR